MPVMDGFDSCRAIRAWEKEIGREAMPVIALTAHVVGEQADAWRSAGMNACITKPFTLAALHACLERWLAPGTRTTSATTDDRNAAPHSQPGAGDDADLIDHQILDEMRGMQHVGQDLVTRIVALYGEHAPAAYARLTAAASSGENLRVADAAHALKSLSLSIGASRVASLCGEIERRARTRRGADRRIPRRVSRCAGCDRRGVEGPGGDPRHRRRRNSYASVASTSCDPISSGRDAPGSSFVAFFPTNRCPLSPERCSRRD